MCRPRIRNEDAPEWGTYMLVDAVTNFVVWSGCQSGYGLTLHDLEDELVG